MFVSVGYDCKVLTNISVCYEYIESLFLEIKYGSSFILIGVLYRPPIGNKSEFIDKVDELLSEIRLNKFQRIIIVGDYNIDMLNVDDRTNVDLVNMFYIYLLLLLITRPTRITTETDTLLDNIFISLSKDCTAGSLVSDMSDHLPIFCFLNSIFPISVTNMDSVQLKYRLINDLKFNNFCGDLVNSNLNSVFESNDISRYYYEEFC